MNWLVLIVLLFSCSVILLLLKINIEIAYRLKLKNMHHLKLKVSILRIPCYKRTFYFPSLDDVVEELVMNPTGKKAYRDLESQTFKHVKIKKFDWETGVGIGEAHLTGITASFIWTGKEIAIRLLEIYFPRSNLTTFIVKPNYHGEGFYSRLNCTLTLPVYTFLTIIKELKALKK